MMFWLAIGLGVMIAICGDMIIKRRPWLAEWWHGTWMVISVILSALSFAEDSPLWGIWLAICAVFQGVMWWKHRNRRKRKRAAAMLGAKSRARITKLILRQREAVNGARS